MIVLLILVIIAVFEYLLYKKKQEAHLKSLEIQNLNTDLDLVKAFTYLLAEKNKTFEEIMAGFSAFFFAQQENYNSITLNIIKENCENIPKSLQYHKGSSSTSDISIPLNYYGISWGNIVFGKTDLPVRSAQSNDSLEVLANMVVILLKRFEFDDLLIHKEQVKAVSVQW